MLPGDAYIDLLTRDFSSTIAKSISEFIGSEVEIVFQQSNGTRAFGVGITCLIYRESDNVKYTRRVLIGQFSFSYFPGNCGIVVFYSMIAWYSERNLEYHILLQKISLDIFKYMGFTKAIYTTAGSNVMEESLAQTGWKIVDQLGFVNKRTNKEVKVWQIDL
jgi:hypothetical protein